MLPSVNGGLAAPSAANGGSCSGTGRHLYLVTRVMAPHVTPRYRYAGMMDLADEPESLASEGLAYLLEGRFVVADDQVDIIVRAGLPGQRETSRPTRRPAIPRTSAAASSSMTASTFEAGV